MGVAALVLGILGILCSFTGIGSPIGILFGIPALVLGIVARKRARTENAPSGLATAGMVVGIVSLAFGALVAAACAACGAWVKEMNTEMQQQNQSNPRVKQGFEEFNRAAAAAGQAEGDPRGGKPALPDVKKPASEDDRK